MVDRRSSSISSTLAIAVRGRIAAKVRVPPVPHDLRMNGKVCLVTGANTGLGKVVAIELAARGGDVIVAVRRDHDATVEDIRRRTGSERVRAMHVELSDTDSVHRFCDQLAAQETRLDLAILNAGLMPANPKPSAQGFDPMFAVHFLANRVMVDRWLEDRVVVPARDGSDPPRLVLVSSESHRTAGSIDFDELGRFVDYSVKDGLKYYGLSKMILCTYAQELSRRLNEGSDVRVAVHSLCPGPVATDIARDAPPSLKWFIHPLLKLLFQSPQKASRSVIYLACADKPGKTTGMYLHMLQVKEPSPVACDPENGKKLWEASQALVGNRH